MMNGKPKDIWWNQSNGEAMEFGVKCHRELDDLKLLSTVITEDLLFPESISNEDEWKIRTFWWCSNTVNELRPVLISENFSREGVCYVLRKLMKLEISKRGSNYETYERNMKSKK